MDKKMETRIQGLGFRLGMEWKGKWEILFRV